MEGRSRRRGACAGSALPGPLLWRRSSAPGAPRGGGWGAPPRMRPGRGSAAPGRLGAELRSLLLSSPEPEERGIWGHGALAAARRSHQRRWWGRALHRHAGGQDSVTTGRDRPPIALTALSTSTSKLRSFKGRLNCSVCPLVLFNEIVHRTLAIGDSGRDNSSIRRILPHNRGSLGWRERTSATKNAHGKTRPRTES